MIQALRFSVWSLLLAVLALTGCQSTPLKGLTPEQIAVLKSEGFTPTDEGWAYDLSGKALLGVGIQGVRVDGHADASGKAAYNQQLSERRAQSVSRALVAVGMQAQNIQSRGLGSSQPVADNRTSAGRTENRRVSIVVASY